MMMHRILLVSFLVVLAWSAVKPKDGMIWWLELSPILIVVAVLVFTYKKMRLTTLTYVWLWLSAVIVAVGGHYTYEQVPLFNWIRDEFGFARNHFDRLGHFVKGVSVALLAREVLLRSTPLRPGKWMFFLATCVTLATGALYELLEMAAALVRGESTETFLGTQGDEWDAQWDLWMLLIGSLLALWVFGRWHERMVFRRENEEGS